MTAPRANERRCRSLAPRLSVRAVTPIAPPRDPHRELERLLAIEAWIDLRTVGTGEIGIGQAACAAGALRDIVAGELDVNTAKIAAHLVMDAERVVQLLDDGVEAPRLDSLRREFRVSVLNSSALS